MKRFIGPILAVLLAGCASVPQTEFERIQAAVLFAQPGYGADADRQDVFEQAAALPCMKRVYALQPAGSGLAPPAGCSA